MKKVLLAIALAAGAAGLGVWAMSKDVKRDEQATKDLLKVVQKMPTFFTPDVMTHFKDAVKMIVSNANLSPELLKKAKEGIGIKKAYLQKQVELASTIAERNALQVKMYAEIREKVWNNKEYKVTDDMLPKQRDHMFDKRSAASNKIEEKYKPLLAKYDVIKNLEENYGMQTNNWPDSYYIDPERLIGDGITNNALRIIRDQISARLGGVTGGQKIALASNSKSPEKEEFQKDIDRYVRNKSKGYNKDEANKWFEIAVQIRKGLEDRAVQEKIYRGAAAIVQNHADSFSNSELKNIKETIDAYIDFDEFMYGVRFSGKTSLDMSEQELEKQNKELQAKRAEFVKRIPTKEQLAGIQKVIVNLMSKITLELLDTAEQAIDKRLAGK